MKSEEEEEDLELRLVVVEDLEEDLEKNHEDVHEVDLEADLEDKVWEEDLQVDHLVEDVTGSLHFEWGSS